MRTRHPFRIAAAALLALASFVPLTGSAVAGQTKVEYVDGVAYKPISTKVSPSWYTPEFERRLLASGTDGVRLPEGATLPGGVSEGQAAGLAQPGIRPGQWLLTLLGSDGSDNLLGWCTANFVFKKSAAWGLGTAGHCGKNGQLVSAYVVPPPTSGSLPGLYVIGKISVSHDNGIGDDFAMIDIFPEFASWMNPTMPVWGGPSGVYTGSQVGLPVKHFGHGTAFGAGGTPRVGAAIRWDIKNGDGFSWVSAASPGDSGSGVLAVLGEAAGDLTHLAVDIEGNVIGVAGTRMTKILQIANGWTLADGSLVPL
ncbi:hypothetical protein [Actinomadura alba]|uniref:Uncharacterized protein n=1 Tax=Actinomadura alba TaxID=406431 RepID=A0ABR7LVV6_9ACTN|nr:hypothetical protein [Actinomadura alba]MBC6468642.1 hypothetical protein [Actinomadura alba]